jgi:hypothetical protein
VVCTLKKAQKRKQYLTKKLFLEFKKKDIHEGSHKKLRMNIFAFSMISMPVVLKTVVKNLCISVKNKMLCD